MHALRHRSETLSDPRPVLAIVFAGENLAFRGGEEQSRAARPGMPRHGFDAAVDERGQTIAQLAPGLAAIDALQHRGIRRAVAWPFFRARLRARHDEMFRIV